MFNNCVLLFTIFCVQNVWSVISDRQEKNSDNYGPYELVYNHYEVCKGPKLQDAGNMQFTLVKNSKNEYIGLMNLTMKDQSRVEEIRIVVFALKNDRKNNLFNYRLLKPCEHFAFATPIQFYLHADKKNNCSLMKGSYVFDINVTEYARLFFGKSFFYGNFLFKVTVLSTKGNIMCLIFNANFNKIT